MIKQIQSKNFQSHKDTTIDLDNGVNVILGPSDCGKSAIRRALRWVFENRPSGDNFRSYWGGDTCTDIVLNNGICISREKGKENLYVISEHGEQPKEFRAFGQDVPEEIKKILNASDINLQTQHSLPFLIFDSPGEVAKFINKIADLDIIDKTLSNIAQILKKENNSFSTAKEIYADFENQLKEYDWVENADIEFRRLKNKDEKIEALYQKEKKIDEILYDIQTVNSEIKKQNKTIQYKEKLKELEIKANEIENLKKKEKEITNLLSSLATNKKDIVFAKSELSKFKKQFDKLMPDICPLCGK